MRRHVATARPLAGGFQTYFIDQSITRKQTIQESFKLSSNLQNFFQIIIDYSKASLNG